MTDKKRIIVIDDYPEILAMIAEALEDESYDVRTFLSHDGVFELVESWSPDLVVLDLMISGVESGWTLIERLRHHEQTRCLPIVLCSAATREIHEAGEILHAQGVEFLEKPFSLDGLIDMVGRLTQQSNQAAGGTA